MKKLMVVLFTAVLALSLMACGTVTLHCDSCGKEVQADSKMTEDWIIFCKDCEPEINFD